MQEARQTEKASGDDRPAGDAAGRRTRLAALGGTASRILLLLLVLALAFSTGGFFRFASQIGGFSNPSELASADGIVVLTGGKARIETGLSLLERGKGRRLLISGVHPDSSPGSIRRAVSGSDGLFDCCVDFDKAALDTVGNAEQAGRWARENGFASLIIVTSDYHMPRSILELRRKAHGVTLIPYIVETEALASTADLSDPEALRTLVPEYFKYLAAWLRLGVRERTTRTAIASAMAL